MRRPNTFVIVAAIVAGVAALVVVNVILRRMESAPLSKAPDHGTTFLIEAAIPESGAGTNDLTALKEAMLARASRLGVRVFWEPVSATRARLSAPISDPEKAQLVRSAMCRGGLLEIRLVHLDSDRLVQRGENPAGYRTLELESDLPNGQKRVERLVVTRTAEPGLGGPVIKDAMVMRDSLGRPEITISLRPAATEAFAKLTRENVGRRVAIIVDGKLFSAPIIRAPIEGGMALIEGSFTKPEALQLADALDSSLRVPVKLLEWKDY